MNSVTLFGSILLIAGTLHAGNWPAWRGPTGDGISAETNLPTEWSATKNVVWKTPLPGGGNSTPIVWGDKVILTQATEKGKLRSIFCFNRKTGAELWKHTVTYEKPEMTHDTNPYCSGSPATDGERIVACFASAGIACVSMDGKLLWHRDLGEQRQIWGAGPSPVIAGNHVFINFGPGPDQTLYCLNKQDGTTVWKHAEPGGASGEKLPDGGKGEWIGSWGDPLLRKIGEREELITNWPLRVCAYDPATGRELWQCKGLNQLVYTSPVVDGTTVVSMGAYGGNALAVKAGGSGDVTAARLWLAEKTRQRIGSPVVYQGHAYILTDIGFAECRSLETGKIVWEERLKGPGATAQNWSSLVLSGDKVYGINQSGDAFIFRAAPKFELLATNSIGEKVIGSIAPSDGQLFIRSYQHLWCIGSAAK